jgi:plasmid stabilization system protein ParE
MLNVELRPRGQADLESIYIFLALERGVPHAAKKTLEDLYGTIDIIAEQPEIGTPFQGEVLDGNYRRMLSGSYWIFYTVDEEQLVIWRVIHGRRDIDEYAPVGL